jgi:DNA-binding helix-hairpin-helix protein with protein kinase domain
MQQLLKSGQILRTVSGHAPCTVRQYLGGGTQGEVYVAELAGNDLALKWYFPNYLRIDKTLHHRLEMAMKRGAPSNKFLWPLDLVTAGADEAFGYVMPLREPRFKSLIDLMRGALNPRFWALATAGFELANAYFLLHSEGLCYRDINFGNVAFDPNDGDIRVCDNDNVGVSDEPASIGGTVRFMAPEIVRGEALPNTQTDLFSLAVLLFHIFMVHHPLEGKREYDIHALDGLAMKRLYGEDPIFIFDPNDSRNAPVPDYHETVLTYWPLYPKFLRDLFVKAFTKGLHDPQGGRVVEGEWRTAMVRLRDSIMYCGHCDAENFYDQEVAQKLAERGGECWRCHKNVRVPPRIRIKQNVVMLNRDSGLYAHHIDDGRKFDFSQRVAVLAQNPQNPSIWGLTNLSESPWVATFPDASVRDIEPGRSIALARGLKINFGKVEGEIRV